MNTAARIALALGLTVTGSALSAYTWKNVVIGGGGFVPGFVYHPTVKGLMYARTDMGGAYRWNPASGSWNSITDWMTGGANDMGILSIALDPQDGAKIAMLTGKYTAGWGSMGNVLISSDTGKSFVATPMHMKVGGNEAGRGTGERLAYDPNLGTTLYLANSTWDSVYYGASAITTTFQGSVWKSVDGGKKFDSLKTAPRGYGLFVVVDPASGKPGSASQTVYASFDKSNAGAAAIWRSTNAGATWSLLPGQPTGLKATNALLVGEDLWVTFNKSIDHASSSAGQIWRYHTKSSTWTNSTPATDSAGFGIVAVSRQNPSIVAVGTTCRWAWDYDGKKYGGDGIWLSKDKGATWKLVLPTNDNPDAGIIDNTPTPWKRIRGPHWIAGLAIDPFDSASALYGTGAGVYRTRNLFAGVPTWTVADSNLEETVSAQVVSPPSGAPLLTSFGDQGGFRHERLDRSPANAFAPDMGSTMGIDVAWLKTSHFAKVHSGKTASSTYGTYSTDSGKTWTGFATQPAGTTSGGTRSIAFSSGGSTLLWCAPGAANPAWSANLGATWTSATGLALGAKANGYAFPFADKVNDKLLYVFDRLNGAFYTSRDGGRSFAKSGTTFPATPDWGVSGSAVAVPGREGHLWLAISAGTSSQKGLWHSTNGGTSFTRIASISAGSTIAAGASAPEASYPTLFLWGTASGTTGLYRSTDSAQTWVRVNDGNHQYGIIHQLVGDPRVYSRVYLATEGRGIVYGQEASTVLEPTAITVGTQRTRILTHTGNLLRSSAAIALYDLKGSLVRRAEIREGRATLNLGDLPRGLYLARSGNEAVAVQQLR